MNVSSISVNENSLARRNFFIKYTNSFMSNTNGNEEAIEKAKRLNENKKKGIETLTIFPKEVKDGKTIITA